MNERRDGTDVGDTTDARVEQWIREERETRRSRPPTRTLKQAAQVFASHDSPKVIAALGTLAAAGRMKAGPLRPRDAAILAGVAAWWPVQEWAAHRWILHMKPAGGWLPMFARAHRRHHRNPSDLRITLLPPVVPVQAFAAFGVVAYAVTRRRDDTFTQLGGLAAAAMAYEWVHYLTHTDYRPKSEYFRRIWRNHRMHHYRNERNWYAFTVPHVDAWLGTDPDDAETSATARSL